MDSDLCACQLAIEASLYATRGILVAQSDECARRGINASGYVGLRVPCFKGPGEEIELPGHRP